MSVHGPAPNFSVLDLTVPPGFCPYHAVDSRAAAIAPHAAAS
jgi:hypothetical protein